MTLCLLLIPLFRVWGVSGDWFASVWTAEDGIPDNGVRAIAQTPDGYLWVATEGGLSRFDGARFQRFQISNVAAENSGVARLFVDAQNQLWMLMNRGAVICVGPQSNRIYTLADKLPEGYPRGFIQDGEGAGWISYASDEGATRVKDGKVTTYGITKGLFMQGGLSLATDAAGRVWFGKNRAMGIFRDEKFETLITWNSPINLLAGAEESGLWVISDRQLYRYEEGREPQRIAPIISGADPTVLLEDRTGTLWMGTSAHGLYRLDGSGFKSVHTSHRDISCLSEDREGNLWVGTRGGGLNRLRPRVVKLSSTDAGLPVESLRSICRDTSGAIWAVARNSLVLRREGDRWVNMCAETNWPGGHAFCVAADPSGGVWIGMWGRGLFRYCNGSYREMSVPEGLLDEHVRSVMVSSKGEVWVTTDTLTGYARLQRLRGREWHHWEMPAPTRILRALAEDKAGNIWIGSGNGRLLRMTENQIFDETPAGETGERTGIRSLVTTEDGSVWIGYAGIGLGRIKDGRYTQINSAQGLGDDYVSQIINDGNGWLWCCGSGMIFKVALHELIAASEGRAAHVRSIVYGRGEGVPGLQAAYEAFPAAFRDADGAIQVATRMGLATIDTERIRDNPDPPSVVIERVAVNGHSIATYDILEALPHAPRPAVTNLCVPGAKLKVHPNHRKLDIEFTALSFTAPENVQFRYRLEGFDEEWIEAGRQRSATYSQLPAGNYRFHVVACNNSGLWNNQGAALTFAVLPFFWQTWWFRTAAGAGLVLGIGAVVRYVSFRRLRRHLREMTQQAAIDKERTRIAHDLHDDLGASLTHVTLLLELAAHNQAETGKANGHLQEGLTAARQAIKALDETVWAVNPSNNTLAELIGYIGQFALEFLQHANIRCRMDVPDNPPDWPVSFELRHNLFLMVKEALNNVVRHAHATEVEVQINVTDTALTVRINDNGRGFDRLPEDTLADGVRNMRSRAEALHGQFEIASKPGGGTRVAVVFFWPARKNGDVENLAN